MVGADHFLVVIERFSFDVYRFLVDCPENGLNAVNMAPPFPSCHATAHLAAGASYVLAKARGSSAVIDSSSGNTFRFYRTAHYRPYCCAGSDTKEESPPWPK
jgi:hypothetical protein